MESHLLQMRGLKLMVLFPCFVMKRVASFTDAWIETKLFPIIQKQRLVASFTDAWIETEKRKTAWLQKRKSHLLQMRGLKLNNRRFDLECEGRIFYRCVD